LKASFLKIPAATQGSQEEFYKNSLKNEDLQRIAGSAVPERQRTGEPNIKNKKATSERKQLAIYFEVDYFFLRNSSTSSGAMMLSTKV
jgi:hypothetical protein